MKKIIYALFVAAGGALASLQVGEAQVKKLPSVPSNPPVEAMERCSVEVGKPGNVLRSATMVPKPNGGGLSYVARYECVYIPGVSAPAVCSNGGKAEFFEPGYLDPASKPGDLAPCKNAVVLCCKN